MGNLNISNSFYSLGVFHGPCVSRKPLPKWEDDTDGGGVDEVRVDDSHFCLKIFYLLLSFTIFFV